MNQRNKLSLLLLTKNESENIKKNLFWLKDCPAIGEIVVVDDFSTDDTLDQLKKVVPQNIDLKISQRRLDGNFSQQRIFALSQTSNNWILWLDADETPSHDLIDFLNHFDYKSRNCFAFLRQENFLNHPLNHGDTACLFFIRLFNKEYGLFEGLVHETWQPRQPVVYKNLTIIHQSNSDLRCFLHKINFYTSLRAQELQNARKSTNLIQIIVYPLAKFINGYILRLGFLDGTPGIIFALSMSFHSFLVRSKLWHMQTH